MFIFTQTVAKYVYVTYIYNVACKCMCVYTHAMCMNISCMIYTVRYFVSEGTVRLEDGPSNDSGRVEVFTSGLWHSICVNTWSIDVANLVCVQLGYLRAEEAYLGQGGVFGQGTGPILEDLQCPEAATILQQCSFNISASGSCSHSMDAAVMCTSESYAHVQKYHIYIHM